jgi:exodeoxyribonuclease VII large subunit
VISTPSLSASTKVLSVTEAIQHLQQILDEHLSLLGWIGGEISSWTVAQSGHWYFTIQDKHNQIKCVMFRGSNRHVSFPIGLGKQVQILGAPQYYGPSGQFQWLVTQILPLGHGARQLALEKLKEQLRLEGLFDSDRKKTIPFFPKKVGVLTSLAGAAIHDVMTTLTRRAPHLEIIIYPIPVQGTGAHLEIAKQLKIADERRECDVLLMVRGGGSIDDLWSFNEEILVRTAFECQTPIISGVGHESDVTLIDLVADLRAPTPTGAAELVCQPDDLWLHRLQKIQQLMRQHIDRPIQQGYLNLDHQREKLSGRWWRWYQRKAAQLQQAKNRLISPGQRVKIQNQQLQQMTHRLTVWSVQWLSHYRHQLQLQEQNINQLNPQTILRRGYSIARTEQGEIVQSIHQVNKGTPLTLQLSDGTVHTFVDKVQEDNVFTQSAT